MLLYTDFTGSADVNPYLFIHFDLNRCVIYLNGRQGPSEGFSVITTSDTTCSMTHQTLYSGLVIHHDNRYPNHTHIFNEMVIDAHLRSHARRVCLGR